MNNYNNTSIPILTPPSHRSRSRSSSRRKTASLPASTIRKDKKIYFTFYFLYNQDFLPESNAIFRYLEYVARNTPYEPVLLSSEETHADAYHILLGKEELKDPVFLFSWMKETNVRFTSEPNPVFLNACMVILTKHRQDEQCAPYAIEYPHNQYPTFHIDFNMNRNIHECTTNEETVREIFQRGSSTSSSSSSPSQGDVDIVPIENLRPNQLTTERVFETKNYEIVNVEGLYARLVSKNPSARVFIDKKRVEDLFASLSTQTSPPFKEILFDPLSTLAPKRGAGGSQEASQRLAFQIPPEECLSCDIDPQNEYKITQRAMIQGGDAFAQFYLEKYKKFKSISSKKYIMARYYIQNLQHRNQEILQRSDLFANATEFQNAYYLGFDLEYFIVPHLQTQQASPIPKSLLLPLICRIQNSQHYILYYILFNIDQNNISLYYAFSNLPPEENIDPQIHSKVSYYIQQTLSYSFLSQPPIQMTYTGLPPNHTYKMNFLKPGHVESFHHLFTLFQILLNTRSQNSVFDQKSLSMFIDLLNDLFTK